VRKKVKSGRYNNASEVVREALRRMENEDARAVRLAKRSAEEIVTDLTEQQLDGIRRRVRAGIESIETGKYTEYDGREGLTKEEKIVAEKERPASEGGCYGVPVVVLTLSGGQDSLKKWRSGHGIPYSAQ
jgi:putative addiction module CopG family antidote